LLPSGWQAVGTSAGHKSSGQGWGQRAGRHLAAAPAVIGSAGVQRQWQEQQDSAGQQGRVQHQFSSSTRKPLQGCRKISRRAIAAAEGRWQPTLAD